MEDSFGRNINYLRISVTDRCNLRCNYCMPAEGVESICHSDVLSYENIIKFTRAAVKFGVNKVRLTGGEPLVRKNIIFLVEELAKITEIKDLAMTTNGIQLRLLAKQLKNAGLNRVNVSLDTLSKERYSRITRGGDIDLALAGITAAQEAELFPIKINCVIQESENEKDALEVAAFAKDNGLGFRTIKKMNISTGKFWPVSGGDGGQCKKCNRLRLSCDGFLRPCLFSDLKYNIMDLGFEEAIKCAIGNKPAKGLPSQKNQIHAIGG